MNPSIETTLDLHLFRCPLAMPFSISDIRSRLEVKYGACLALDGLNGHPIDNDQIKNESIRSISGAARNLVGWSIADLADISGSRSPMAEIILAETLNKPVWGADDAALFNIIEEFETLQTKAENKGNLS